VSDDAVERIKKFADKNLPEFRKQEAVEKEAASKYADLVPDFSSDDPETREIDDLLDRVDIVTAYNRWCDKSGTFDLKVGRRTDGIMIRCPIPGHEDKTPSASLNTAKLQNGTIVSETTARHGRGSGPDHRPHRRSETHSP